MSYEDLKREAELAIETNLRVALERLTEVEGYMNVVSDRRLYKVERSIKGLESLLPQAEKVLKPRVAPSCMRAERSGRRTRSGDRLCPAIPQRASRTPPSEPAEALTAGSRA